MKSFIEYSPDCEFPVENLPYGVFSTEDCLQKRIGVAIGDQILDLYAVANYFTGPLLEKKQNVFRQNSLNDFMALGRPSWIEARKTLQRLLSAENTTLQDPQIRAKLRRLSSHQAFNSGITRIMEFYIAAVKHITLRV
ncbi:fumarylacetoacetase-like [Belonocnema kinseyi]|uniref:fumarylacetoacetase-like n=1 Tax=Belonocnema kinseyi TaxID=2817044 RepID=UPI00143D6100|nr:fumarylacetoacetase-like [Belonocnema kinseyi]